MKSTHLVVLFVAGATAAGASVTPAFAQSATKPASSKSVAAKTQSRKTPALPGRAIDRELVQAARSGNLTKVRALINRGANPKAMNGRGLEAAVFERRIEVVRELLQRGAPISFQAFKYSLTQGPSAMAKLLIEGGANLNQVGKWDTWDARTGYSAPLIIAVMYSGQAKRGEHFKLLLDKGAQVNLSLPDGTTILDAVQKYGNERELLLLIERGVSIDKYQKSLLEKAMEHSGEPLLNALKKRNAVPSRLTFDQFNFPASAHAVKTILAAGGDPNQKAPKSYTGWTILHEAALYGEADAVRALLDAGADIGAKASYQDYNKEYNEITEATPLFLVNFNGDDTPDSLKKYDLLLSRGANPNATETRNGFTPLLWLATQAGNHREGITKLMAAGAKLDAVDKQGRTALHLTAFSNSSLTVDLLKANSAPGFVNAQDKQGRTPLMLAVLSMQGLVHAEMDEVPQDSKEALPAIDALVKVGADIHVKSVAGVTLLHLAAAWGFLDETNQPAPLEKDSGPMGLADSGLKIEYLWQHGLKSIDVQDNEGATPLFRACQYGNMEAAATLLHYGANPSVKTKSGATPRSILAQPARLPRPKELGIFDDQKTLNAYFTQYDQLVGLQRPRILALLNRKQRAQKKPVQKGASQKQKNQKTAKPPAKPPVVRY
jgi:ankyrin repeat protein